MANKHKKMLNISVYDKKDKITSIGMDMEKLEYTYIVGENVKLCKYFAKHFSIPQNVKHRVTI